MGVAPRQFLRTLIDVLDRIELHPSFDPRTDYNVSIPESTMSETERAAAQGVVTNPDDIEL